MKLARNLSLPIPLLLFFVSHTLIRMIFLPTHSIYDNNSGLIRQVNVPNLSASPFTPAVFWLGKVDLTSNYADMRAWYLNNELHIMGNIIDRLLWFDPAESIPDLENWDSISLYLNMDGGSGEVPGTDAYLFQSQLGFQAGYQGNESNWEISPVEFMTETTWRGNWFNDSIDDKGWQAEFIIPFTSLGLSGPPPGGTIWGLAVSIQDRDGESVSTIPDQVWPEGMMPNVPATWGQLRFGLPDYVRPPALPESVVMVRDGLNGLSVKDAHVGGHTICGAGVDHWSEWGDANYPGYDQINIQNQWDIADYPCFSKYFITFPLDSLPAGQTVISANLTMTLFGNAGGGEWGDPPDSYIQVLTVGQDWDENSLTWNNAPLPVENISGTWVYPRDYEKPDQSYLWDVSRAVAEAVAASEPLRLALYSADGERHSGKYFWSSNTGDWNVASRPTLHVYMGLPCDSPGVDCNFIYAPIASR